MRLKTAEVLEAASVLTDGRGNLVIERPHQPDLIVSEATAGRIASVYERMKLEQHARRCTEEQDH